MKAWVLFVLLAVLVGIGEIGVRQDRPKTLSSQPQAAQRGSLGLPSMEAQLSGLRPELHEADQVFTAQFLGGDGCSSHNGPFYIPAHGSFIVQKVLKGHLKEGDFVSGEGRGCFPQAFWPFVQDMPPMLVAGRWQGSASAEEELGSVSVPSTEGQIHYIRILTFGMYSPADEPRILQIVQQIVSCREFHQIFWVGQPPGTARVVVDPEQPPEGTSVSFTLCITEENFDPEIGEVEVWNYVVHNFGFQGQEAGSPSGVVIRNVFGVPTYQPTIDGLWVMWFGAFGLGSRRYFSFGFPKGQYEPYLSDQDVYVFGQQNWNLHPNEYWVAQKHGLSLEDWQEKGKPVDILRGALWIPKPK